MCKVFGGLPLPLLLEGCSDELSGSLLGSVSEGGGVYCSAVGGLPGWGEAILVMLERTTRYAMSDLNLYVIISFS